MVFANILIEPSDRLKDIRETTLSSAIGMYRICRQLVLRSINSPSARPRKVGFCEVLAASYDELLILAQGREHFVSQIQRILDNLIWC